MISKSYYSFLFKCGDGVGINKYCGNNNLFGDGQGELIHHYNNGDGGFYYIDHNIANIELMCDV